MIKIDKTKEKLKEYEKMFETLQNEITKFRAQRAKLSRRDPGCVSLFSHLKSEDYGLVSSFFNSRIRERR